MQIEIGQFRRASLQGYSCSKCVGLNRFVKFKVKYSRKCILQMAEITSYVIVIINVILLVSKKLTIIMAF